MFYITQLMLHISPSKKYPNQPSFNMHPNDFLPSFQASDVGCIYPGSRLAARLRRGNRFLMDCIF